MPTFTEVLPARKSSKHSALNWTPTADGAFSRVAGVVAIHTDRASASYAVSEFACDWPGRSFHLAKLATGTDPESEAYSVFCAARGPAADLCDCKGFTFKGTCKHADAVRALVANGWV